MQGTATDPFQLNIAEPTSAANREANLQVKETKVCGGDVRGQTDRDEPMGRRVIAIVAALVLALLGVVVMEVYHQAADGRALAGQAPTSVFLA